MTKEVSFPGLGIESLELDPVAFSIGSISVTWYSLIITTGIILAVLYVYFRFKEAGLSIDDLIDFALFVIPSGVIGARLYYVIFEWERFNRGDFFDVLYNIIAVWNGGLAIYGAVIAGALAAFLVARYKKIKMLKIFDMLAPAVMMAQAIGRWGNFMNVEAFGGPTDLPWRMTGPSISRTLVKQAGEDWDLIYKISSGEMGAHPTFLYESLWNIIGFIVIYFVFVRNKKLHKIDGQLFYSYLIWYGLGRMLIEGLRTDSLYLFADIRVSQLVAFLSLLSGIGLMIYGLVRYNKTGHGKMVLVIPRDKKGRIVKDQAPKTAKQKNKR